MPDLNNNTAQSAKLLPLSSGLPATISGELSNGQGGDLVDFYKFSTSAVSSLKLSLSGLTGNARLAAFAAGPNGTLGAALAPQAGGGNTSNISNSGRLSESFVFNDLAAGDYIIRVDLDAGATVANYELNALASQTATANSVLWQKTAANSTDPLLFYWQMNGANVTGQFSASPSQNPEFTDFQFVGAGDFDGDQTEDVLWKKPVSGGGSKLFIWFMNPDNTLRESKGILFTDPNDPFTLSDEFTIERIEDFNGDSKSDILLRQTSQGVAAIWQMDGANIDPNSKAYTGFDPTYKVAATGDFNNDGKRDVILTNTVGGLVGVWMFDENLNLVLPAPGQTTTAPSESGAVRFNGAAVNLGPEWEVLGVADLNKAGTGTVDDNDDVIFVNKVTGSLATWLMNGSSIIQGASLVGGASISGNPGGFDLVGIGDLNGDGNGDLVWRPKSKTGLLYYWQMKGGEVDLSGTGALQYQGSDFSLTSDYEIVIRRDAEAGKRLVDFDGDQKADMFLRDPNGVTILWAMMVRRSMPLAPVQLLRLTALFRVFRQFSKWWVV